MGAQCAPSYIDTVFQDLEERFILSDHKWKQYLWYGTGTWMRSLWSGQRGFWKDTMIYLFWRI